MALYRLVFLTALVGCLWSFAAHGQEIDFGSDTSMWANDGECDDPRFSGPGMASVPVEADLYRDATDCREAYQAGRIRLDNGFSRTDIDFGDDSGEWALDGECDDPRFEGSAMASFLVEADRFRDATDCRQAFEAGQIRLIGSGATDAPSDIDFGDDSGEWARDGECDDPRFEGTGMAAFLVEDDLYRDATDCREAFELGTIRLRDSSSGLNSGPTDLRYGDNSNQWAFDGECDDPRFSGPGMAGTVDADGIATDADDCRRLSEAGQLTFLGNIEYGDDTGDWPFDDECDDPRFGGDAMAAVLDDSSIRADATDCERLFSQGRLFFYTSASDRSGADGPRSSGSSSGSGFLINTDGQIVTNAHVVEGCQTLVADGVSARLVAVDDVADLAVIETSSTLKQPLNIRSGRGLQLAEDLVVSGYPLSGLVTSDPIISTGTVSALSGPNRDRMLFQMSAPVQPGNSGGPVLDSNGNLVGVVVSKLDALRVAEITGDIPQNVNFAVSLGALMPFLDTYAIDYTTRVGTTSLDTPSVARLANQSVVYIECNP
ncbi:MAG: serine protease [Pseudomonadota bacterium]